MRSFRSAATLLPLVLLAPLTGALTPASAAEQWVLTLTGGPAKGVYYDQAGPDSTPDVVRHRGRLTADGEPVADATVYLERTLVGGTPWFVEETTDAEGRYRFRTKIEGNATYRVTYDDNGDGVVTAESRTLGLKAMRDFNAGAPIVRKEKAILKGNINPGWENRVVHWERKKCRTCRWREVVKQRSGDNGSWRFAGSYPPVGEKWVYRAWLARTDTFVKSYSARMVTTTTPAREPAARTGRP